MKKPAPRRKPKVAAPPPPSVPPKRGRGRPSKYKPEFATQAKKLCLRGATDADLADFFEVDVVTIWRWSMRHEEFCKSMRAGKDAADARVERSLYQRAVGYTFDSVKIFMPAGAREPVYAKFREHVPPDPTSGLFWLKNRKPEEWRDLMRQEIAGPGGGPVQFVAIERLIVDPSPEVPKV